MQNVTVAYTQMVTAIAAFERTATISPFSSKFDRRDLDGVTPEVVANVDNRGSLGELNLGAGEIQDVVAFLRTFSDR